MLRFFFKKIFLKGISWIYYSLQQLKTVLQLTKYFFFWVFCDLTPLPPQYNSYYLFLFCFVESSYL